MADDRYSSSPPKQGEPPLLIPLPRETEIQNKSIYICTSAILCTCTITVVMTNHYICLYIRKNYKPIVFWDMIFYIQCINFHPHFDASDLCNNEDISKTKQVIKTHDSES